MTRGSVEDTTAYATTNSTGYAESVLGAGIGSNGKVLSLTCLPIRPCLILFLIVIPIMTMMPTVTIEGGDGELVQPPRRR